MKKLINTTTFIAALLVSVVSTNASAVTVIDFGTGLAGAGGTITYADMNVVGEDIPIGALIVDGAPQGNGVYEVNAVLNFDTGAVGEPQITIFGTVDQLVANPTFLLSGDFSDFEYYEDTFGNQVFAGTGPDTKACELLCQLGLDTNTPFNFFGFSIESANGTVVSTDIVNTAIPVPAAVWLFGSGLIGLVAVARRRQAA